MFNVYSLLIIDSVILIVITDETWPITRAQFIIYSWWPTSEVLFCSAKSSSHRPYKTGNVASHKPRWLYYVLIFTYYFVLIRILEKWKTVKDTGRLLPKRTTAYGVEHDQSDLNFIRLANCIYWLFSRRGFPGEPSKTKQSQMGKKPNLAEAEPLVINWKLVVWCVVKLTSEASVV